MGHLRFCVFLLSVAACFFVGAMQQTLAVETGAISGVVTDATTKTPLAGARVTAVAPSGSYKSTTNASGFYSFVGLPVDTYTVSASMSGYLLTQSAGITVLQGISYRLDLKLQPNVKTIGKVSVAANKTTLVQKDITVDQYNVTTQQMEQLKGQPLASEQFGLLTQLPGVSNAGGYPLLRGGLENNEGYQIEGITVVDPFYNQFSNNDTFNGAQSIQVVLGAGDASQGGAGSGYVNEVVKRGTYPGFGILQGEVGLGTLQHNVNFEYGSATPDNRFSWFLSGRYQPYMAQGGAQGSNGGGPYWYPQQVVDGVKLSDQLGALAYTVAGDTAVNLFGKVGPSGREKDTIQFYDDIGMQNYVGNYGLVTNNTLYYAYDPIYANIWTFLFPPPYNASILPVNTGQNPAYKIPNVPGQIQNYELTKVADAHQFSDVTYLNAWVYRLNGDTNFNLTESNYPYLGFGFPFLFGDFFEATPFQTSGAAFDIQTQAGDKNFVTIGGDYNISTGHLLIQYPSSAIFAWLPHEWLDFAPGLGGEFDPTKPGATAIRMPYAAYGTQDPEYKGSAYFSDSIKPTDKLTIEPALRWETQRIHQPAGLYGVYTFSPKFNTSYEVTPNTVLRASFGHSTILAPLGQVEYIYQAPAFFKKFPSDAAICGPFPYTSPCANYYDQILADEQANIGFNPAAFPKAQQSDSYDFSIEQNLGAQVSAKLTTWYRRDYDVLVNEALPIFINGSALNGPTQVTNNGSGNSFGVDLGVTRQLAQGLSGQLNATYINQFINYLSGNAFIPTVLPSTLATRVHPPYLAPFVMALALDYRRNGWRISPDFIYSHGNPTGFPNYYYVKTANGTYNAVLNTNYFGNPSDPCYFVDPQVPGTPANPNIVGALGGGCDQARDGVLSKANVFGNLTLSKDVSPHSTVGVSIFNLFNNRVVGLYNGLAGGNFSYVNNGFGAYGAGSGYSQYGPKGCPICVPGAPAAFPPGPFFNTQSGSAISGLLFVNVHF